MPGKRLTDGQKDFVLRLINYFNLELKHGGPLLPLPKIQKRVGQALGISETTVGNVVRENRLKHIIKQEEPAKSTPRTKFRYAKRKMEKTQDVPDAQKAQVRSVLDEMLATDPQLSLKSLKEELEKRDILKTSSTSLWRLLRLMGCRLNKNSIQCKVIKVEDSEEGDEDVKQCPM